MPPPQNELYPVNTPTFNSSTKRALPGSGASSLTPEKQRAAPIRPLRPLTLGFLADYLGVCPDKHRFARHEKRSFFRKKRCLSGFGRTRDRLEPAKKNFRPRRPERAYWHKPPANAFPQGNNEVFPVFLKPVRIVSTTPRNGGNPDQIAQDLFSH